VHTKYCLQASADADIDPAAESVSQKLFPWTPEPQQQWRPGDPETMWLQNRETSLW